MNRDLASIPTPDGRSVMHIVEVRLNGLTPHYLYAASETEARAVALGDTSGVWEFSQVDGPAFELVPVPADRYAAPRTGGVLTHPLMAGTTAHRRVVDSQRCLRDGCSYTRTYPAAGNATDQLQHADYPHEPGTLYDCPACESRCHCTPDSTECVYSGTHTS